MPNDAFHILHGTCTARLIKRNIFFTEYILCMVRVQPVRKKQILYEKEYIIRCPD